jgi:hypothetical protein
MAMAAPGVPFGSLLGEIWSSSLPRCDRRRLCELAVASAARGEGRDSDSTTGHDNTLWLFEDLMLAVHEVVGGDHSIGLGQLKKRLRLAARPDLEKRVSSLVVARRAAAHPDVSLVSEVRRALSSRPTGDSMEYYGTSDPPSSAPEWNERATADLISGSITDQSPLSSCEERGGRQLDEESLKIGGRASSRWAAGVRGGQGADLETEVASGLLQAGHSADDAAGCRVTAGCVYGVGGYGGEAGGPCAKQVEKSETCISAGCYGKGELEIIEGIYEVSVLSGSLGDELSTEDTGGILLVEGRAEVQITGGSRQCNGKGDDKIHEGIVPSDGVGEKQFFEGTVQSDNRLGDDQPFAEEPPASLRAALSCPRTTRDSEVEGVLRAARLLWVAKG